MEKEGYLRALEDAGKGLRKAQEDYDYALLQAYLAGSSAREIGKAVGRESGFSGVWAKAKRLAGE